VKTRILWGAVVLFALVSRQAGADIVLSQPVIQSSGPGVFQWSYFAVVSQEEAIASDGAVPGALTTGVQSATTKDYFTIVDFAGYLPGFESMPAGWAFQSLPLGSTPDNVRHGDDPGVPNLTWYYTGATIAGPHDLGIFSARSIFDGYTVGDYVASATNTGAALGTQDNKISQASIPATTVPEPASLLLLGVGLLACVWMLRRQKVAA